MVPGAGAAATATRASGGMTVAASAAATTAPRACPTQRAGAARQPQPKATAGDRASTGLPTTSFF